MNTLERSLLEYNFIGSSQRILEIRSLIEKIAPTDVPVLLVGETGVGKGVVAREIYKNSSPDYKANFLHVNCASIQESLAGSDLFGYIKGAFTGANGYRKGFLEATEKGTLFLDEVSELSNNIRARLLTIMQERYYIKVGEDKMSPADVRIIAATSNPEKLKDKFKKRFVFKIKIPSLSERKSDIPFLVNHFLSKFNERYQKEFGLTEGDMAGLSDYNWPGNIRELESTIKRSVILGKLDIEEPEIEETNPISEEEFYNFIVEKGGFDNAEGEIIRLAFTKAPLYKGSPNLSWISRQLGIKRTTLDQRIRKHGLLNY